MVVVDFEYVFDFGVFVCGLVFCVWLVCFGVGVGVDVVFVEVFEIVVEVVGVV